MLLERVAEAGYAVRAPLLPGHGTTPSDLQTRTWDDWYRAGEDELARAHAEFGPVIVCGFSMGSLVALALAMNHPTRVRALVVMGCALRLSAPLRAAFAFAKKTRLRLPDAYVPKPFGPDVRDPSARAKLEHYDRHPIRAAMEVYRAGQTLTSRLGSITCPALVLHGERDRVCSIDGARELASKLGSRDVTFRSYARSAHLIAVDYDREEVAADVLRFVVAQRRPVEP